MDSVTDPPCGGGCPIRRSSDQSLLAAPQGLSQRATSFIASRRQGIHQMPFSHSPRPSGKNRCQRPDVKKPRCRKTSEPMTAATDSRPPTGAKQAYPCRAPPPAPPHERREEGEGRRHPCQSAGRQGTSPERPVAHHHHTMSRVKERLPPLRQPTGSSTQGGCPKLPSFTAPELMSSPEGEQRPGLVGPGRLERPTSRLSGVRSNQLSYRPVGNQEWGCPWVRLVS